MKSVQTQPHQLHNLPYWSAEKLALCRNPELRLKRGFRVKVPRGTKRVYIPRKNHYTRKVYTEEKDLTRLETLYDDLEPCIVTRSVLGWQPHSCKYHPLVIIEEQ